MKSKKALFAALDKYFYVTEYSEMALRHRRISNETYGRTSCIYISFETPEQRLNVEQFLENEGFKVNRRYARGSSTTEVQVSYFKGFHWDE